ncbi:hypothetical protein TNCV_3202111 [Trichonephila clavipes]|nr:hypothetical protein TNCV_3202111 [Trichonephila clavipes]
MEYRLSEYSPTEKKVDDREGQCNVWYNGNCKGGDFTPVCNWLLGRVVEVYNGSDDEKNKEWHKHMPRAQQSNMQPDLRMHICEHIICVLQHQKDVNQKQHICVKHDFVVSNHTITVTLHSGTTQWKILGSGSMFSSTQ